MGERQYTVKEIFPTLQGEGVRTGTAAVFLRFAGCNLWSGREEDRAAAQCRFCDTDFVGGEKLSCGELVDRIEEAWRGSGEKWVVCTGGEPLLQLDAELIDALHAGGIKIAAETNGTIIAPDSVNWLTVSPKAAARWVQKWGHELKLVYPQMGLMPDDIEAAGFWNYCLQPMDGPALKENTAAAIAYCMAHPQWRLSLQTHKWTGIR